MFSGLRGFPYYLLHLLLFLWRSIFTVLVLKVQVGIHLEPILLQQAMWVTFGIYWAMLQYLLFLKWFLYCIHYFVYRLFFIYILFYSVCQCLQNDPWKNHLIFFFFFYILLVCMIVYTEIITWSVWIILHNHVTGQWVGGIESVKFCTFCRLPRVCMI